MNINSFTSKDDDHRRTPPRRVSARKKAPLVVDSSCFKRPYKWAKSRIESNTADISLTCEPNENQIVNRLIGVLFGPTPRPGKQAKAIHTFRVKKTKRIVAHFNALSSRGESREVLESIRTVLKFRPKNSPCVGRSLFAMSRARNSHGKFQSVFDLKKSVAVNEQAIDDWCSVNHTTAACSHVELTGVDPVNRSQYDQFSCFEDFLSITESKEKDNLGSKDQNGRVNGYEDCQPESCQAKKQEGQTAKDLPFLFSRMETIYPDDSLWHFLDEALERDSLFGGEPIDRSNFECPDKDPYFQ
jgi:hypothetical protein